MYIYLITNLINNKKYIGQTNDFYRRMRDHCNRTEQLIDKKIHEYGKENFSFQILEETNDQNKLNELEKEYIKLYNSIIPNGYNICQGGMNNSIGQDNNNAKLTEIEAQWILNNRDTKEKELYEICPFKEKISYSQFKNIYCQYEWKHLNTNKDRANNLSHPGEESGKAIYTNEEVYKIREDYANGIYYKDAWERSGKKMSLNSFYQLYIGRGYVNVHYDVYTEENKLKHRPDHNGENNGRAKLTKEDVIKIRELHKTLSNSEIYKLYPQVSTTSIRNIINRKTWTNI